MDRRMIETSEESGAQPQQIRRQDESALHCNASSIATPVNNSLCCAAAGITASSSATADALIPHEKLRGAELADATLLAQKRLFAQPALRERTFSVCGQFHRGQLASRNGNNLGVVREYSGASHHIFFCAIREQTREDNAFLESPPNFQEGFDHFRERQIHGINPLQSHELRLHSGDDFGFESDITGLNISEALKKETADSCRAACHTANKLKSHLMPLATSSHSITGLLVANVKGSTYSRYSSERLEPCSSIFLQTKRIEHDKQRPTQSANRQKNPNHPYTCDFHALQNFKPHRNQWHRTTKYSESLTGFEITVHGGAA